MNEGTENNKDGVPYTDQDEFYKTTIEETRQNFGADYSKLKTPLLYFPNDGDVTLNGLIPSLGDAEFHFRYADSNGCYLWLKSVPLTDEVVLQIQRILATYKNWKSKLDNMGDKKPISYQQNN